ncbi:MAG: hypothetical protein R3192_12625 [Woeseiaceae bacterium]|nr:hypothetical protein [Woeseiaceae bacterium]
MDTENQGWADKPENRRLIRRVLYVACALLVIADFVVHRHIYTPAERIPVFYALYGFVALVGVVMAAKGLRLLVKRDEDYYER